MKTILICNGGLLVIRKIVKMMSICNYVPQNIRKQIISFRPTEIYLINQGHLLLYKNVVFFILASLCLITCCFISEKRHKNKHKIKDERKGNTIYEIPSNRLKLWNYKKPRNNNLTEKNSFHGTSWLLQIGHFIHSTSTLWQKPCRQNAQVFSSTEWSAWPHSGPYHCV